MTHITIVGDSMVDVDVVGTTDRVGPEGCLVLDVDHERRRPGAAALAATFAASDGVAVRLVTAIGDDEAGRWLVRQLDAAGVDVVDLGLRGPTPQKWRYRAADGTIIRADHNCRDLPGLTTFSLPSHHVADGTDAVLVSDYGRGVADALRPAVAGVARSVPVVWDPHPRGPEPPRHLDVLVPNEGEARRLAGGAADEPVEAVASALAERFSTIVAVTCGAAGAVVADADGAVITVPTRPALGDTCGAGDRLAARVAVARASDAAPIAAVVDGVDAASRFVAGGLASRRGAADGRRDPVQLAAITRRAGGRVVAAGGCFDLLHAGHVELLESARALGDCLIVCLNSNESIRRLKGNGRPIVDENDRRRILEALECVDAVAVFDEPTPVALLEQLRPHVFAKGADYAPDQIPEGPVMAQWGGTVAILPLVGARSTTNIIQLVQEQVS
jgi:D-beta-D-heptose 7-phosphate kinase / D-beta-D-heptose 1-phosphate adenosyltransferase